MTTWIENNDIAESITRLKTMLKKTPILLRIWNDGQVRNVYEKDLINIESFTNRDNLNYLGYSYIITKIDGENQEVELRANFAGSIPFIIKKEELSEEYGFFQQI